MVEYIVLEGNMTLSADSLQIKAVTHSMEDAVSLILKNHEIPEQDILAGVKVCEAYDKSCAIRDILTRELCTNRQTQGYSVNYAIQEVDGGQWN